MSDTVQRLTPETLEEISVEVEDQKERIANGEELPWFVGNFDDVVALLDEVKACWADRSSGIAPCSCCGHPTEVLCGCCLNDD